MSLLVAIDHNPTTEPVLGRPAPEKLIAGDPHFKTWEQDEANGGDICTGIWEATPGETRSAKGSTFEFCQILSGVVELTEEGAAPRTFRAGDSLILKPGFKGIWKTIETVRKVYVTVG